AGTDADAKRRAAAVQEWWRSIYIDVEMAPSEGQLSFANLRTGNFNIAGSGWIADFNDPRNFLFLFLSGSELNHSGYKNPAYDALIEQADQEQDFVRRGQILAQAEAILLKEAFVIPNQYQVTRNLVQPYVKGWITNLLNLNPTRWLSVERPEAAQ
ncbi:MAG TPA: peptide ABC transporter substrate-binding protein, partial [Blastocatellia bacterium]|nr:peptide ABC transporter substrate-binding protein [Blastocatellia bacterium]